MKLTIKKLLEINQQLRIEAQTEGQLRRQAEGQLKMLTRNEPKNLKPITLGEIYSKCFEKGWRPNWGEKYYRAEDVIPILAKAEANWSITKEV